MSGIRSAVPEPANELCPGDPPVLGNQGFERGPCFGVKRFQDFSEQIRVQERSTEFFRSGISFVRVQF
jgi:hypothetical protein